MIPKSILVATDFSETSDAALAYAHELAQAFGATLHVLHVTGNVMAAAAGVEGFTTDFAAIQREVDESARKQLDRLVSEVRQTAPVKTIVLTSNNPAQSIVSYAADAQVDLVVVGTHGRGGLEHLLMGSVAERVVRTAPCAVLAVRRARRETVSEANQAATHAHA